jgi:Family of unknown function (DUF6153)
VVGVPRAITRTPRLCRWVAVVTLALGLVAMHHLVGTHTHLSGSQDGSPGMTMLAAPIDNDGSTTDGAAVVPARPGTDGGLMLHPCQAVLTGLVLLAGLSLAWWLAPASKPGPTGDGLGAPATRQRAPPTPLRLASLGVLRL